MKYYTDNYLLKDIRIKENNEKLVDVKKYVKGIIIQKNNVFGKETKKILVRGGVVKKLDKAVHLLPPNYRLIIYDGYREEKIQRIYFLNYFRKLKKQYPGWEEKRLKEEASKYVANPESFSPHLTGGAVDVSIAKGKRQIRMGGFIGDKDKKITKKTMENRKFLAKIMEKAGFVSYPLEWWHWSYGDLYWAAVKKREYAIYGEIRANKKFI